MMNNEKEYLKLLKKTLKKGEYREDRTGVGTYSLFGEKMEFDLQKGFPLLTTKKMSFKLIAHELLWFLSSSSNVEDLHKHGVYFWDPWADRTGELGPIYGVQWRSWHRNIEDRDEFIDQIDHVITELKNNPNSRRHIVSAWNVGELEYMNLPPCHLLFQFYVDNENRLHCQLYQRSADMFIGVPFNIASYALLTHMIAQVVECDVGTFTHVLGDTHIYSNHIKQVKTQLKRFTAPLPKIELNPDIDDIDDFTIDDIKLMGYHPAPPIKALVAV